MVRCQGAFLNLWEDTSEIDMERIILTQKRLGRDSTAQFLTKVPQVDVSRQ